MTNRQEIVWFDIEDSVEGNKAKVFQTKHAVYPLCRATVDNVLGLIYIKDLIGEDVDERLASLATLKREPVYRCV